MPNFTILRAIVVLLFGVMRTPVGLAADESILTLAMSPAEGELRPLSVQEGLARIRRQIEERAAEQAVQGSTVTLTANEMPVEQVFEAIEKQTQNGFRLERHPNELAESRITIELKDEPFWAALDRILDQATLSLRPYANDGALSLVPRRANEADRFGRASYDGPFRMELLEIQAQRDLRRPTRASLQLQLEIAWEPRLQPIALLQLLPDVVATAEGGGRIAVTQPQGILDVEVPAGTQGTEIVLPFELPPRETQRIASVRGKVIALVPSRKAHFRFDDLANAGGQSKRDGGVKVTLESVRKNEEIWELRMLFAFDDSSGVLQSHRGWVFENRCYLVRGEDEPIENVGFETTRQTPAEIGVVYFFDVPDGIDGLTWIYESPAAIVELPVDYEFNDIQLP